MLRGALWVVSMIAVMFGSSRAGATAGEVVLNGKRAPITEVAGVKGKEVILFGPFELTPELRKGNQQVYIYVPISYGGKICYVFPYVADAANKKQGKQWIDDMDGTGSFATMEDGHKEPRDVTFTIVNYDVKGTPFRPLGHFRTWKQVIIALVIQSGDVQVGQMVVSPYGPSVRREEMGKVKRE